MRIVIGCDRGGYALKERVRQWLEEAGVDFVDLGCSAGESVDYTPIAAKAAHMVARGQADRGILICTTGLGVSMAANKVKGVRAAVCTNAFCAEMTRRHNDANVLCMGGKVVDPETAVQLVDIFLNTGFDGDTPEGERHLRRVRQLAQIENGEL